MRDSDLTASIRRIRSHKRSHTSKTEQTQFDNSFKYTLVQKQPVFLSKLNLQFINY